MSLTPKTVPTGAIRYNTDSNKMECFNGTKWMQVSVSSPDLGKSTNSDIAGGARGIFAGGADPNHSSMIQAFDITTTGNTFEFGHLSADRYYIMGCSSRTRAVWAGGSEGGGYVDTIEYSTIASTGNYTAFGELVGPDRHNTGGGLGNQTRGLYMGGENPGKHSEIDQITIASTGNSVNFGHLSADRASNTTFASPTRGISAGGTQPTHVNTIDYVTIATEGTAQDFGDQSTSVYGGGGGGNSTRGIMMSGFKSPNNVSTIQYVTIASTGNSVYFGDVTQQRRYGATCSSPTRAVYCGGANPAVDDRMDYINIATLGDAVDFGDLFDHMYACDNGCSTAHGGL